MIQSILNVTSIDIPQIEYYTSLKRPVEHLQKGIFIIEGDKVVQRFLSTDLTLISILLIDELFDSYKDEIQKRAEPVQVFLADKKMLENIVGFKYHQGVMAVGKVPESRKVETIIQNNQDRKIFVAFDRIESAENTGVLIRNCAACGVDAVVRGETSADPYLRRAVRNSMGTIFQMPILRSLSLKDSLLDLRQRYGFKLYAAHPRPESIPLFKLDFDHNCCIVFGNEGDGISEDIVSICDISFTIPMEPGVDSFNVACASAIVLYEATRKSFMV